MFTIINKLRPVTIDCFTYKQQIIDYYHLRSPSTYVDYYDQNDLNSFVVPIWCDLAINIINDGQKKHIQWNFVDGSSVAESHPYNQYQGFVDQGKMHHLKIVVPWLLKEKSGIRFITANPQWALKDLNNSLFCLPGVVDFKYNNSINIQLMLNYPQVAALDSILVPAGMPLYQVFPVSERKIRLKYHLISSEEYWSNYTSKFSNHYHHKKKMIDKCPFH